MMIEYSAGELLPTAAKGTASNHYVALKDQVMLIYNVLSLTIGRSNTKHTLTFVNRLT